MRTAHATLVAITMTFALVVNVLAESAPAIVAKAGEQPARTVADEAAVLESGRVRAKQRALARLAEHPDPEADKVLLAQFARHTAGRLPVALWLDLFEAAAKRDNADLKAQLATRGAQLEKGPDSLASFRECLAGGDADAGRTIFTKKPEAGCIRCHSIDGVGGAIGPDLTWLRHSIDRIHVLESLILPNSTIAAGFQHALLKLKNGEEFSGVVTTESNDELTITSVIDGKKRTVRIADIAERTPLASPMPPHFKTVLTKREIRDLVEFLAEGD